MTHTLPESSIDLDVDALLARLLERPTPTPSAAKSSTAEVDELLTRALREVGLTALMQPRTPGPPPANDPAEQAERDATTIESEPIPPPQRPRVLAETPWLDASQGRRTLLEFSPNTEGVYALRRSTHRRRARSLTQMLGRLAENVLGIWVAAIAIVTATIVLWTRQPPVRGTAQTSAAGTPPRVEASRPIETGAVGSAAVASAPPREALAASAASATSVETPVVSASRASRGPRERSTSGRADRTAARVAQNVPALAAPPREISSEPTAPPVAEPPPSLPQFETRAVTDVVAESPVASELTLPATADAPAQAVPTNAPTAAPTIVSRVQPVYPPLARSAGIQGTVRVEVMVDDRGRVVRTSATTGPLPLRAAAEAAVRHWRFTPAIVNGVPQPGSGSVTVVFRLH